MWVTSLQFQGLLRKYLLAQQQQCGKDCQFKMQFRAAQRTGTFDLRSAL